MLRVCSPPRLKFKSGSSFAKSLSMNLQGSYVLHANEQRVWDFMSDPKKFGNCLPELQSLEVVDDKTFRVTVRVGMLFFRGKLKFDFTIQERSPPTHTRFEGVGKGAGVSVRLDVNVDLKSQDDPAVAGTELSWRADAQLGGLLSEISPSLLQSNTSKFTRQFFECVKAKVEA
jgi:carbon monoxide dehydrogenase subunit G